MLNKKRSPNKFNFLFPPTLVEKLLEKKEISVLNREWWEYIGRYLETRDSEYLREKGEIKDETITYIDAPTVVWEAINWWQNIHNWLGG